MQRDIVTRWVMTRFTQIPQSSKEVRICFNKDTRRNGIMTSLGISLSAVFLIDDEYSHLSSFKQTMSS